MTFFNERTRYAKTWNNTDSGCRIGRNDPRRRNPQAARGGLSGQNEGRLDRPDGRSRLGRADGIPLAGQDWPGGRDAFLRTLELYGMDVSIRQAGIDFANSGYPLWHANKAGRDNLRKGIAPPDSGHPKFNDHADDIDYQIEADYAGLIAPGRPRQARRSRTQMHSRQEPVCRMHPGCAGLV